MTYTKEQFNEIFKTLPKDIKEAIISAESAEIIQTIAKNNNILPEKVKSLGDEVGLVMMGITKLKDFSKNLENRLGISSETSQKIIKDVNEMIFKNIQESLKKLNGENQNIAPIQPIKPVFSPFNTPIIPKINSNIPQTPEIKSAENTQIAKEISDFTELSKEEFNKLPQAIKSAIEQTDLAKILQIIGQKNGLSFNQIKSLEKEIMLVMTGMEHPDNFSKNLEKRVGISSIQAETISKHINDIVFKEIRQLLIKLNEEKTKTVATNSTVSFKAPNSQIPIFKTPFSDSKQTINPFAPKKFVFRPPNVKEISQENSLESKNIPPVPSDAQKQNSGIQNWPIKSEKNIPTPPPNLPSAPAFQSILNKPNSSVPILNQTPNVSANIIDNKMNKIVRLPREIEHVNLDNPKKESMGETKPTYNIDPYREPIN